MHQALCKILHMHYLMQSSQQLWEVVLLLFPSQRGESRWLGELRPSAQDHTANKSECESIWSDAGVHSLNLSPQVTAWVKHDEKVRILSYRRQRNGGGRYLPLPEGVLTLPGNGIIRKQHKM